MTMRAKFQQCLHSTGPTGPDSLELPTVLSASPRDHLARSHRCRVRAEEVSMWTALLLPGLLKSLHTARRHFPRLPWSGLPRSSLHTMHTLAGHASMNMENAVGKASLCIPALPSCQHDLTSLSLNNQVCRDPSLRAI